MIFVNKPLVINELGSDFETYIKTEIMLFIIHILTNDLLFLDDLAHKMIDNIIKIFK
jgi:hypothetical protein